MVAAIRRKASFSHDEFVGDTIHVCLSEHDTDSHTQAPKPKRRRITRAPSAKAKSTVPVSTTYPPLDPNTGAPIPDPLLDDVYRRLILSELKEELTIADSHPAPKNGSYKIPTHGQRTQRLLQSLLQNASHPKTNSSPNADSNNHDGPVEALYLNQSQATALIESPYYDPNVLLIVQDKRYFEPAPAVSLPFTSPPASPELETKTIADRSEYRPISLFFDHLLPTLHRQVSVQIPSQPVTEPSGQLRTLRSIRERFHSTQDPKDDPWNVLDLSTPIPSTTPSFLQGPGSQLLRYIRSEALMAGSSGAISPPPSPVKIEESTSGLMTPPTSSRALSLSPLPELNSTPELPRTPSPSPSSESQPSTPPSKKRGRPPTSSPKSKSPSPKKQKTSPEKRAERLRASPQSWREWTNVQSWSLLSQGGHHTPPHCDAFGFDTWITVQEGMVGFGWLSTASATSSSCSSAGEREGEGGGEGMEERKKWAADPHNYTDGSRWRFVILKPKQTVFFPSGTVHFVFRLKSQDSLSVGGHVLRWDGVERWLTVVLEQMENGDMINEDMEWPTVKRYVDVVGKLVARREKEGGQKVTGEKWEGLVKEFKELAKRNKCR
ncbi:hypothetical protein B0T20DRAFT_444892 [Sordaria brevicollis]|uniref:JmjC domain-containing protein n=1 Tax=Sordaria brevicollis TaxID=83679 RepID=A0AAE0P362_SORBR|nr:hypothetical protein B0T20DRAFT_444892 [Sordaria brevicollis]